MKDNKNINLPKVDVEKCIGCGACEGICPDVFKIVDGKSIVQKVDYGQFADKIKDAKESCPVEAIS